MNRLLVQGTPVNMFRMDDKDYISLTDMLKAKDGDFSYLTGCGIEILLNFRCLGTDSQSRV